MGMMAGTGAAEWQLELETVEERCGYLLTSGIWSDCTFMVGPKTNQAAIPAHKLILAMASPVFEAMFYGEQSEGSDPIISIPDVQPEAFKALLPYIYTGNINITSFEMAIDLWHGANKYKMPHLVNKCNSYVMSVVCPQNACRVYEITCFFGEKTLVDKCVEIISTKAKEVLNDSSFEDVDFNTLMTVLSFDHLNVDSELDLFYAVERYAKAEQKRTQIDPEDDGQPSEKLPKLRLASPTTEKKVLSVNVENTQSLPAELESKKPAADNENLIDEETSIHRALQKIRFLSLTPQQFAEGPARSDLLTKEEIFALLMNISSADSPVPMPPGFSECRQRRRVTA